MNEVPPGEQPPVNATDRNVKTAAGIFTGHITLPCAFVTFFFVLLNVFYLLIVHWQFDQITQVRARLGRQEELVQGFLIDRGVSFPGSTPGVPKKMPELRP